MLAAVSATGWESISALGVAAITIIPATLSAFWARSAKRDSNEAKKYSAGTLHEVRDNGGVVHDDPTLKDYVKYIRDRVEVDSIRVDRLETLLEDHVAHSNTMDSMLAEIYYKISTGQISEKDK